MMGERLPETSRVVIPINLKFSATLSFIHKEQNTFWSWEGMTLKPAVVPVTRWISVVWHIYENWTWKQCCPSYKILICYIHVISQCGFIWNDMIYLLTAIGLSPGGSSTVQIYTQTIHRKLYAFFWVITRRLDFICRRFGTLCLFHLHRQVDVSRMKLG